MYLLKMVCNFSRCYDKKEKYFMQFSSFFYKAFCFKFWHCCPLILCVCYRLYWKTAVVRINTSVHLGAVVLNWRRCCVRFSKSENFVSVYLFTIDVPDVFEFLYWKNHFCHCFVFIPHMLRLNICKQWR